MKVYIQGQEEEHKYDAHILYCIVFLYCTILYYFFRCKDGYVKVYIQGQEEEHKYDAHDYEFCGTFHELKVKYRKEMN